MSKPYLTGEQPRIGDVVSLLGNSTVGPRGRVIVVLGGETEATLPGQEIADWKYLGSGILMDIDGMGLVFDDDPSDEVSLIERTEEKH